MNDSSSAVSVSDHCALAEGEEPSEHGAEGIGCSGPSGATESAKALFQRLKPDAAWYRELPSASPGHTPQPEPMLGVLVTDDLTYRSRSGRVPLLAGGMLLQADGKSVRAVHADDFTKNFMRCFRDGTQICRLSDSQIDQAMALSRSNTQMRKRIEQLSGMSVWATALRFLAVRRQLAQLREWNLQIQAHIVDLAARSRLEKSCERD